VPRDIFMFLGFPNLPKRIISPLNSDVAAASSGPAVPAGHAVAAACSGPADWARKRAALQSLAVLILVVDTFRS
jgi:hypothetical protein